MTTPDPKEINPLTGKPFIFHPTGGRGERNATPDPHDALVASVMAAAESWADTIDTHALGPINYAKIEGLYRAEETLAKIKLEQAIKDALTTARREEHEQLLEQSAYVLELRRVLRNCLHDMDAAEAMTSQWITTRDDARDLVYRHPVHPPRAEAEEIIDPRRGGNHDER